MKTELRGARLSIGIATLGRFHVLDLARELDALGHEVKFYSYVPKMRARKFGLPEHCHVTLWPRLLPWLALVRICRTGPLADWAEHQLHLAVDDVVAQCLAPCDVFIAMSGMYTVSLAQARIKYGAKVIVERGSTHIEVQKQILDQVKVLNPQAVSVPAMNVARELEGYAIADLIVVPSSHAEESFLLKGVSPSKLFKNSYGADLTRFKLNARVQRDPRLLLFVGAWSYQKGVDVLVEAMRVLAPRGFRLCHVGVVDDAPLPDASWFCSQGELDQLALPWWYQHARCLILPSRQDGFGLVLLQALSCGCPIIGSTMTGAPDLMAQRSMRRLIQVVPVEDSQAIAHAVEYCDTEHLSPKSGDCDTFKGIGWPAYAQRYERRLYTLLACSGGDESPRSSEGV